MNYCHVENNTITDGPKALPKSWRNVSGLDWLSEVELRQLGWLPVRLEEGAVNDKFLGSTFEIFETEVVETKQWRAFTQEEQAEQLEQKAQQVRVERNKRLAESDWTQLADAPVNSLAWSNYRQSLRDIPSQEGFPMNVTWPTPPTS